jgi:hypothetical protein
MRKILNLLVAGSYADSDIHVGKRTHLLETDDYQRNHEQNLANIDYLILFLFNFFLLR